MAIWNGTVLFFHHDNTTTQPPSLNIDWFLGAILGIEHPGTFEAYAAANLTETTPVVVYEQAQLVFFTFGHNFYHVMSEYMPTVHTMLCRYLGLCTYDPKATTQLIMVDPFNVHKELWGQPVNPEFTKCVTSLPVRHVQSPQFDGKLVVLKNVLAGWGSEARADHGHMHHWCGVVVEGCLYVILFAAIMMVAMVAVIAVVPRFSHLHPHTHTHTPHPGRIATHHHDP